MESTNYKYSKGQYRFKKLLSQKDKETRKKWEKEQIELRKQLIKKDDHNWVINNDNNTIKKEDEKEEDKKEEDEKEEDKKEEDKKEEDKKEEDKKKEDKKKEDKKKEDKKENNKKENNKKKEDNKEKEKINSINSINIIEEEDKKEKLRYIGGVDISFDKYDKDIGISGLVVCDLEKDFEIVYEDYKLIKIEEPYIPSFLAFREVNPYVDLVNELKKNKPEYIPQVILVDGNGILHTRGFGIASHLGVLVDIPTIGCAKTVFALKDEGITEKYVEEIYNEHLKNFGDSYSLTGYSGEEYGYALRTTDYYDTPLIISLGHKVSNETALEVAKLCCYYKEPEPIRLADKITRRLIKAYQKFIYKYPYKKWNLKKYFNENFNFIHNKLGE